VSGRVFICHASENAAAARLVVELLEAAGTLCWIAPRNIAAGADFTSSILEGLAAAPAVVLIFSSAANSSPHVRRELETAIGRDTPLLPVRVEDVDPSPSLRYFIGTSQWLDTVGVPVATWGPTLVAGIARITGRALPTAEPPPVLAPAPAALPPLTGTTWGRDALVAEVCGLLEGGGLVTLTGVGGVGKSRVAAEAARRVDGLAVVDDATPAAVQGSTVLATSRRPLRLPGERVVLVPPLDEESASQMFGEVSARTAPGSKLDADRVAEICRLLGGLPLGLELAASRLRVVGMDRLAYGLRGSLDLVTDLSEALEWSLERLGATHRRLLEGLSLLAGAVPLDAVEAVSSDPNAVDTLTRLVDDGLVLVQDEADERRYLLPHPVRLLARRDLENGDGAEAAHDAVAAYLLGRTADWRSRLDTADGPDVLEAFTRAAPDIEAAVDAAVVGGRSGAAADLAAAAEQLWIASGRLAEARALCQSLLQLLPDGDPHAARTHALLGRLAYYQSDFDTAEVELRTALQQAEALGDDAVAATARCYLCGSLLMNGQVEEGTELAGRVHAESQELGLYPQAAEGLFMLALSRMLAGDLAGERAAHERRLEVVRRHGDVARTADALNTLAEIAIDDGDAEKARRYAQESLTLATDRFPLERRDATITAARASTLLEDRGAAGRLLANALADSGRHGQTLATSQCLRVAGVLAESGGDPALAVRLFAAAQALSPSPTGTDEPPEADFAAALERARAALEPASAEREWTLGGALPLSTMLTQLDTAIGLNGS
jgi:predicted ATPase